LRVFDEVGERFRNRPAGWQRRERRVEVGSSAVGGREQQPVLSDGELRSAVSVSKSADPAN
jgi:hypothetical protein